MRLGSLTWRMVLGQLPPVLRPTATRESLIRLGSVSETCGPILTIVDGGLEGFRAEVGGWRDDEVAFDSVEGRGNRGSRSYV